LLTSGGYFLLADSPIVSSLAPFNPYSLLHIPLYGILTILLFFSIVPFKFKLNSPNQIKRLLIAGFIALVVAIADEIYQSFIPGRDASIIDVFLDLIGTTFVSFLFLKLYKERRARISIQPND